MNRRLTAIMLAVLMLFLSVFAFAENVENAGTGSGAEQVRDTPLPEATSVPVKTDEPIPTEIPSEPTAAPTQEPAEPNENPSQVPAEDPTEAPVVPTEMPAIAIRVIKDCMKEEVSNQYSSLNFALKISLGYALWDGKSSNFKQSVAEADRMMYEDKRS